MLINTSNVFFDGISLIANHSVQTFAFSKNDSLILILSLILNYIDQLSLRFLTKFTKVFELFQTILKA